MCCLVFAKSHFPYKRFKTPSASLFCVCFEANFPNCHFDFVSNLAPFFHLWPRKLGPFYKRTARPSPKTARRKGKNAQERPHPGPSHSKIGWFNHQRALCSRPLISDHHHSIHCDLLLQKPHYTKKIVKFRKIRHTDINRFTEDILNPTLFKQVSLDSNILAVHYDTVLQSLLERHAPLKTKIVTIRPSAPWYTPEVKTKRPRLERKWLATGQHCGSSW